MKLFSGSPKNTNLTPVENCSKNLKCFLFGSLTVAMAVRVERTASGPRVVREHSVDLGWVRRTLARIGVQPVLSLEANLHPVRD